jgi:hypothetical protein
LEEKKVEGLIVGFDEGPIGCYTHHSWGTVFGLDAREGLKWTQYPWMGLLMK